MKRSRVSSIWWALLSAFVLMFAQCLSFAYWRHSRVRKGSKRCDYFGREINSHQCGY